MQEIEFYCKKCKKSMKMSYMTTGNHEVPIMVGMTFKCHTCKKVSVMKNYTEGNVVSKVDKDNRFYL